MDLDTLKATWTEHNRKLDISIRLNRRLLLAANMNRVRSPLYRFAFLVGVGALVGLIGPVILGQFIYQHWTEPRFALPAILLDIWSIASVAASIRQMAMALRIDYGQPITVIQKQIESLRILRIRVIRWALLAGQLVWWTPFLIVALKGFLDVDAYQTLGAAYLLSNVAFGLAVIPLAIWVSRKFGDRVDRSPILQRFMRELAGYNLNAANASLAALSEFEN